MSVDLPTNVAALTARVVAAQKRSPRASDVVTIVAVSKRHPAAVITAAYDLGHRDFGENYALELVAKADELAERTDIRWHYIGHLQRNKVAKVVGRAALIHAVDSERLLRAIDKRAALAGCKQDLLFAVSLAGEAQKSGIDRAGCAALVRLGRELENVRCLGFMTMPPLARDPETNRQYFAELREIRDSLATAEHPLAELSMGSTGDFEVAIEEGATLIRVGTAIFGPRPAK